MYDFKGFFLCSYIDSGFCALATQPWINIVTFSNCYLTIDAFADLIGAVTPLEQFASFRCSQQLCWIGMMKCDICDRAIFMHRVV